MSVYRFPAIAGLEEFATEDHLRKIESEYMEAELAYEAKERQLYGMELLDIIHATETALRMDFSEQEIEELRARVIEKNSRRGYYEVSK